MLDIAVNEVKWLVGNLIAAEVSARIAKTSQRLATWTTRLCRAEEVSLPLDKCTPRVQESSRTGALSHNAS